MPTFPLQKTLFCIISIIYGTLIYAIVTQSLRMDFSSIYSAPLALNQGLDPYQVLETSYFDTVKKISANLNPPFVLFLFTPLNWLNYDTAVLTWTALSFLFGLSTANLSYRISFGTRLTKGQHMMLMMCFLILFSTLISLAIGQLGTLLSFLVILGYYYFLKNNDFKSALCWALACAIKLFPGLLIFFILSRKRYSVAVYFLLIVVLLFLFPYFFYGSKVYFQYINMLPRVMWYGDSWNASLIGLLYRIFVDIKDIKQPLYFVHSLSAIIFCLGLFWYFVKNYEFSFEECSNRQFSFNIVMMLLLSPLGWMYYFSLLILPLCITWSTIKEADTRYFCIWLVALYFINFPLDYVNTQNMHSLVTKLSFYSVFVYGVLFLTYLIVNSDGKQTISAKKIHASYLPVMIILSFSLIVFSIGLLNNIV